MLEFCGVQLDTVREGSETLLVLELGLAAAEHLETGIVDSSMELLLLLESEPGMVHFDVFPGLEGIAPEEVGF